MKYIVLMVDPTTPSSIDMGSYCIFNSNREVTAFIYELEKNQTPYVSVYGLTDIKVDKTYSVVTQTVSVKTFLSCTVAP